MQRLFRYISIFLFALGVSVAYAQNGTSSPFSQIAYGDLNDNLPNAYRGMGGVGIGMRNSKTICAAQPASYTAMDSLTFMMDLAVSAGWSNYHDPQGSQNHANGNLEYLTIQVPLWKRWIAASVGLLPYSSVGYDINLADSTTLPEYPFVKSYQGTGGITQVYGGISFNIMDWFALGGNIYYMFGDATNTRTLTFTNAELTPVYQASYIHVSNVRYRFGAQFFHEWTNHAFVLGAIYEFKKPMTGEAIIIDSSEDSVFYYKGGYESPMMYGVGASYNWQNRLVISADYQCQCFAKSMFLDKMGEDVDLRNRNRYVVGVQYQHNPMGRRYIDRIQWRCGLQVSNPYSTRIHAMDYKASIGVGFPLRTTGTMVNTTLEYGHRGGKMDALSENTLMFVVNASISENWFFKRKL